MAVAAFGHQLLPVLLGRVVCVKSGVAFFALQLVTPAIIFNVAIDTDMALAALNRSKGFRFGGVKFGCWCRTCVNGLCPGCGRRARLLAKTGAHGQAHEKH